MCVQIPECRTFKRLNWGKVLSKLLEAYNLKNINFECFYRFKSDMTSNDAKYPGCPTNKKKSKCGLSEGTCP
jgi:hypothetical protein